MKKIILIEDNVDVRESTKEILELADYEVITAGDGKKGVELVKTEKPDLIICDIAMPDLDGYGVLRILNNNPDTNNIPFVFLTARTGKRDIRKGMNHGADDYITKPFRGTDLLEAVEMRLNRNENLKKYFSAHSDGFSEFNMETSEMEELKDLSKKRKIQSYKKKETIYREDDFANYLYYILKGKVKCVVTDDYGKDFVNNIHFKGDFIGYMSLIEEGELRETAVAMESVEVALIPKEDFLSLIQQNHEVSTKFIKILSAEVRNKEKRLLQMAYAPVIERVADALLKLNKKEETQNKSSDKMEISRYDLANIVGTSKESLIRTLSELKKEELIDTNGQEIRILNKIGLHKLVHRY